MEKIEPKYHLTIQEMYYIGTIDEITHNLDKDVDVDWIPMISDAHMIQIFVKDNEIKTKEVYPWDYLDFKMIPNKNNN
jgi:hypothetical protein